MLACAGTLAGGTTFLRDCRYRFRYQRHAKRCSLIVSLSLSSRTWPGSITEPGVPGSRIL